MLNNQNFETTVKESLEFIEECDLGNCDHASHMMSRMGEFEIDEKNAEAVVAGDTLVSIAAGMSKENKQIVKDTLLFATLAANKRFPDGGTRWYATFTAALNSCGWPVRSRGMSDYRVGNARFTMDQLALKILESAILATAVPGPGKVMLLKVAKDTVDALQKTDGPLRLFEQSSKTHSGAKFAIASTAESRDGEVAMAMGAIDFSARLNVTSVLFFEWSSSAVSIKRAENHMILNQEHYQRVRAVVEGELAKSAIRNILEFDI